MSSCMSLSVVVSFELSKVVSPDHETPQNYYHLMTMLGSSTLDMSRHPFRSPNMRARKNRKGAGEIA